MYIAKSMACKSRGCCRSRWLLVAGGLALVSVVAGCRIGSADSVGRNVGITVAGLYRGQFEGRLVSRHTGSAIRSLNVVQDGSQLQAIDNNGMVFRGDIGAVAPGDAGARSASFTLRGRTTAGAEGVISGTFKVEGSNVRMVGTWAEPNTFGNVNGLAGDIPQPDPDPGNGNGTPGNNNGANNVDSGNVAPPNNSVAPGNNVTPPPQIPPLAPPPPIP